MRRINKESYGNRLGLSQNQIAMLLNVSRSHWSHYVGKRKSLPEGRTLRVIEMIDYMQSEEDKGFTALSKPEYEERTSLYKVEKRHKENLYQLTVIRRKIAKAEEKFEKYSRAAHLMEFLNSPEEAKKALSPNALNSITAVTAIKYKKSKSELFLLQIEEELLQQEKVILEAALKKLRYYL